MNGSPNSWLLTKFSIYPHSTQIDILRGCKVPISGVIGHSFGEHAAAYVAGCLTMKEFILSALARGRNWESPYRNYAEEHHKSKSSKMWRSILLSPPFFESISSLGKVVSQCQQGAMAVVKMSWNDSQKLAEEFDVEVIPQNLNIYIYQTNLTIPLYDGWGILDSVH